MKKLVLSALLAVGLAAGYALAQVYPAPQVAGVGPTDLFQDVVRGAPGPASVYATAAQITNVPGYVKNVPLTAFTLTFGNSQTYLALNPAGTLATGTVTLAPAPSDGSRECIFSTQTITALTVSANTGQSINNAVTTLSANTGVCYIYSASNATWDRS